MAKRIRESLSNTAVAETMPEESASRGCGWQPLSPQAATVFMEKFLSRKKLSRLL